MGIRSDIDFGIFIPPITCMSIPSPSAPWDVVVETAVSTFLAGGIARIDSSRTAFLFIPVLSRGHGGGTARIIAPCAAQNQLAFADGRSPSPLSVAVKVALNKIPSQLDHTWVDSADSAL